MSCARRKGQPGRRTRHWLSHFLALWPGQAPLVSWPQFPCTKQMPEQVIAWVTSNSGFRERLHVASCQASAFPRRDLGKGVLSWPLRVSRDCGVRLVPMGSLQLCPWISGNSALGRLSRKGMAHLHSERNVKSVQWKRIGGSGEGSSGAGVGPGGWCRELRFSQVGSRTEAWEWSVPTNSRWAGAELLTLGRTWLAPPWGLRAWGLGAGGGDRTTVLGICHLSLEIHSPPSSP